MPLKQPPFVDVPGTAEKAHLALGGGGFEATMATMVWFGLIRWHRIWGVVCFRKRRMPQRKRKRGWRSAHAAGIPRRKPLGKQLLPDLMAGRKRLVKQLLPDRMARRKRLVKQVFPEPRSLWGRKPRNSRTKLPQAG
jgi:hypothetical protein